MKIKVLKNLSNGKKHNLTAHMSHSVSEPFMRGAESWPTFQTALYPFVEDEIEIFVTCSQRI